MDDRHKPAHDSTHDSTAGANRLEPEHRDVSSSPQTQTQTTGDHRDQVDRKTVVRREQEEHGGIKWGSAFFGWLTATGMAVLLTAVAAAAGTAFGVATDTGLGQATDAATSQAETVGLVGGIVLLAIVFVAYYCGGYVAGRMARFNGLKQGLGVWLWAIVIAVVAAIVGAVAGAEYNVLQQLDSFPRLPIGEGTLTTGGMIALAAVIVATLGGALLGGLAGMRFHRKVDKTGLGA